MLVCRGCGYVYMDTLKGKKKMSWRCPISADACLTDFFT